MFCTKCGKKIADNTKVCENCGHKISKNHHSKKEQRINQNQTNKSAKQPSKKEQSINQTKTNQSTNQQMVNGAAASTTTSASAKAEASSNKLKIALLIIGVIAIIAVLAVVVAAFAKQKSNNVESAGLEKKTTSTSNINNNNNNNNKEHFEEVLAEYNTYYSQGNSVAYINPNYANTNWSKLIKPVCDELRSDGFKYLPAEKNDLPLSYCFRDVNNDGLDEMIIKAQRYGVLGVYYYNEEASDETGSKISFDPHFCDKTVPEDYENYTAYFTEDNKLVEYAGHNDKAYVRDLSTNPATNIVEISYASNHNAYIDKKGTLTGQAQFDVMIDKMKQAYPEDTNTEWIEFDGQNGKPAKSVEEWWLTGTPVLSGTLKLMTRTEICLAAGKEYITDLEHNKDEKVLVFIADESVTINSSSPSAGNKEVTGQYYGIFNLDKNRYSDVPNNFFGAETYGTFENKHVKLIYNKAVRASQAYDAYCTARFEGIRCAIM